MPSDYDFIHQDSLRRYGEDINDVGQMLLANRYADRTHFIFELLQNAEDALGRRDGSKEPREVTFTLSERQLQVRHFGAPFTEADVKSICRIGRSSKDVTDIGHFGIGFKSVYAFTDRPEIHSGDEDFSIENFVWPRAADPVERRVDETLIILPLKKDSAVNEIERGLRDLGPRTLMFLREIEEITWSSEGGLEGLYLRTQPEWLDDNVRRVSVLGEQGDVQTDERWLIFSRAVRRSDRAVGHVEVAFKIETKERSDAEIISPVEDSPLVVFFPTVLSTHLGFLVQGPFRTTPSRDNVPAGDPWNRHLIKETATLLVQALRWLRDHELLDEQALLCLPLSRAKFGRKSRFEPLFSLTRDALRGEPLLPDYQGSYVSAADAKLGRTVEIRELFGPQELTELYSPEGQVTWLSGHITSDRTPRLRHYLLHELEIGELTPKNLLPQLDREFLERRSDEWIRELYEFLSDQTAILRESWLRNLPLVRLEGGDHVIAKLDGEPQAFLPGKTETGFPTVRNAVCDTEESQGFLRALGLTLPDAVDDVIRNVLPRFAVQEVTPATYASAMDRILRAFQTDSQTQRSKLVDSLKEVPFVAAVVPDAGRKFLKPGEVYLATKRFKDLFAGVKGIALVDDTCECLHGDLVRQLLSECGTLGYLRPIKADPLTRREMANLRKEAGHEQTSGASDRVSDRTLLGLTEVLKLLPGLDPEDRETRAELLWDELSNLEDRRGKALFEGNYTWTHNYHRYRRSFPAAFLRMLEKATWVPVHAAELRRPELVLFDSLGWKADAFLLSKIRFKSPIIEQLAEAVGIEPGVIDLLRELELGSVEDLRRKLGIVEEASSDEPPPGGNVVKPAPGGVKRRRGGPGGSGVSPDDRDKPQGPKGPREFISYVAVQSDEKKSDPDSLEHRARMDLEAKAIDWICDHEPDLTRARIGNPGYDLFEVGIDGRPMRWIEVKAMARGFVDRPVGLSRAQFDCAREHGEAYWLYVVEYAAHPHGTRLLKIRDPAGKARTFTFDSGWLSVAETDAGSEQ